MLRLPSRQFLLGIALGVLLGLCISLLDDKTDFTIFSDFFLPRSAAVDPSSTDPFLAELPAQLLLPPTPIIAEEGVKSNNNSSRKQHPQQGVVVWLRCVVLLQTEKELLAIRDTWATRCNTTLFLTDSEPMERKYAEDLPDGMRLLLVRVPSPSTPVSVGPSSLAEWSLASAVIRFLTRMDREKDNKGSGKLGGWTLLADGRSYVHIKNLHDLLTNIDTSVSLILGRKEVNWGSSPLFSRLLFPLSSSAGWPRSATLSTSVPMVFSQRALHTLAQQCPPGNGGWFSFLFGTPSHSGRTIGGCALRLGIALWDPVDEEKKPLIVANNLKSLFSGNVLSPTSGKKAEAGEKRKKIGGMANCCSHRAIAFGMLNHKDQRLLDYGVQRLKVFGLVR